MKVSEIGVNAGKVWNAIKDGEIKNVADVKKTSKLTDKDLYAAIGWLARESKIELTEEGKNLFIKLA